MVVLSTKERVPFELSRKQKQIRKLNAECSATVNYVHTELRTYGLTNGRTNDRMKRGKLNT